MTEDVAGRPAEELLESSPSEKEEDFNHGPPPSTPLGLLVRLSLVAVICYAAVSIRLRAVVNYGRVIHEFDPWCAPTFAFLLGLQEHETLHRFNYRATQYLVDHGYSSFYDWFDTQSWYPLGRCCAPPHEHTC